MIDTQTVTNIVLGILLAVGIFAQQWDKRQRKQTADTKAENARLIDFQADATSYIHQLIAGQRAHNTARHSDGADAMPVLPIPERIRNVIDPARELDT